MADTKIIINCETGEVSEVELTKEEIAQREADAKAFAEEQAAKEAEAAALAARKAEILDKLGLTEEDAKALLA